MPANCMFRAVAVPQGEKLLSFHYDPWPVKIGILAFGLASGLYLGLFVGGARNWNAGR